MSIKYCCQKLQLDVKRYQRWVRVCQKTGRYGGGKPGPEKPPHRLLPEEKEDIISLAKDDTCADLSHRQLAIVASETGQVESMKKAWDKALSNEGLIGVVIGAPQKPTALSGHGVQMAKKSAKQFFKDLGIKQLFARYQTPKDNAWIESWFRILKYDWLQYKDYVSFDEVKKIIRQFVIIYNTQRHHGAIGYVTPEQKHSGQAEQILKARSERKRLARLHRLKINREQVSQPELAQAA